MEITTKDLDKRICDVTGGENTQTYREFIEESELMYGLEHKDLGNMSDTDLNEWLDALDYLWSK